jgi:MA3 domain
MVAKNALDEGDPNYDSQEEDVDMEVARPISEDCEATVDKLQKIALDFVNDRNIRTCIQNIEDLENSRVLDDLMWRIARLAMDRDEATRTFVTSLFKELKDVGIVSTIQFERAIEKLAICVDDIKLDVPRAPEIILDLADFAVAKGLVSLNFFNRLPENLLKMSTTEHGMKFLQDIQKYKKKSKAILEEFLAADGAMPYQDVISGLNLFPAGLKHEFIRQAVIFTMDRDAKDRERISQLFVQADEYFFEEDFALAFSMLLNGLEDLQLDVPNAKEISWKFLFRALADELLPVGYLDQIERLRMGGSVGLEVIKKVKAAMPENTRLARLHLLGAKIWVPINEGLWKKEVNLAIEEFYDSLDAEEFFRLLTEWDIDETRAGELIRKLLIAGIEKGKMVDAIALIKTAVSNSLFEDADVQEGLRQIQERIEDLQLDIPNIADALKSAKKKLRF